MKQYPLPTCLQGLHVPEAVFRRWLQRKAAAHVRRDRSRGVSATTSGYKQAILRVVQDTDGTDYYTGRALDWHLISQWDNAQASRRRGKYRRKFWNLPTVDHEDPRNPRSQIRLCSWRVNDAKNDQTIEELLELANAIRAHGSRA